MVGLAAFIADSQRQRRSYLCPSRRAISESGDQIEQSFSQDAGRKAASAASKAADQVTPARDGDYRYGPAVSVRGPWGNYRHGGFYHPLGSITGCLGNWRQTGQSRLSILDHLGFISGDKLCARWAQLSKRMRRSNDCPVSPYRSRGQARSPDIHSHRIAPGRESPDPSPGCESAGVPIVSIDSSRYPMRRRGGDQPPRTERLQAAGEGRPLMARRRRSLRRVFLSHAISGPPFAD